MIEWIINYNYYFEIHMDHMITKHIISAVFVIEVADDIILANWPD